MSRTRVRLNPIYYRMLSVANEALLNHRGRPNARVPFGQLSPNKLAKALQAEKPLPREYVFILTDHEAATLQALDGILGDEQMFRPYRVAKRAAAPISHDTFLQYRRRAVAYPRILRWTLLLHDIAKGRYDDFPPAEKSPDKPPHPEVSAKIAQGVSEELIRKGTELGDYALDNGLLGEIIWLVRYHDVLGNIYTGEREPRFLSEICTGLKKQRSRMLGLLQVVALCDMRGTFQGENLTEDKARFWLRFSNSNTVKEEQRDLLDRRIRVWTADLLGIENKGKATAVRRRLGKMKNRDQIRLLFGKRIPYIVNGFYMLNALCDKQLATLMCLIAREYSEKVIRRQKVKLEFDAYRPDPKDENNKRVLDSYKAQIENGNLNVDYARSPPSLKVKAT